MSQSCCQGYVEWGVRDVCKHAAAAIVVVVETVVAVLFVDAEVQGDAGVVAAVLGAAVCVTA